MPGRNGTRPGRSAGWEEPRQIHCQPQDDQCRRTSPRSRQPAPRSGCGRARERDATDSSLRAEPSRVNRSGLQPPLVIADDYNPSWLSRPSVRRLGRSAHYPVRRTVPPDHRRRTWFTIAGPGRAADPRNGGLRSAVAGDGALSESAARVPASIGGDLRRELHAWQAVQRGRLDRFSPRSSFSPSTAHAARRLLDLYFLRRDRGVICTTMKMGLGRPRPRPEFEDPFTFLGPSASHPCDRPTGRCAWSTRGRAFWGLASAASRRQRALVDAIEPHALRRGVRGVLGVMYPRLRLVVDCARAARRTLPPHLLMHWPTDVIAARASALGVTWTVHARWRECGCWIGWRKIVNPAATGARAQQEGLSAAHRLTRGQGRLDAREPAGSTAPNRGPIGLYARPVQP